MNMLEAEKRQCLIANSSNFNRNNSNFDLIRDSPWRRGSGPKSPKARRSAALIDAMVLSREESA